MTVTSLQPSVLVVYIRGQADVLGIQIIDTTGVAPARSVAKLRAVVEMLLAEPRTLDTVAARVERRLGLPADVE